MPAQPHQEQFSSPLASGVWDLGNLRVHYVVAAADAAPHHTSWQNTPDAWWLVANLGSRLNIGDAGVLGEQEAMLWQTDLPELRLQSAAGRFCCLAISFSAASVQGLLVTLADGPDGQKVVLDLPLHNVIQALLPGRFTGEARQLYAQAKSLELLALYVEARARQGRTQFKHCRTEYDRERLLFAREYLLQHYDFPPTLAELARVAGINAFKLKNGFKELFGQPVFAYLNDHKMELALRELTQGVKTASQLAYELGYSSLQHFSRAFKQHFGYPPSRVGAG